MADHPKAEAAAGGEAEAAPAGITSSVREAYRHSEKRSGFVCGECAAQNELKCVNDARAGDKIRCRECGYRILYKKREKRPREFSAR